jgi:hypothetical protein
MVKAPGRIVDGSDGGTWVGEGQPVTVRAQRITGGALLQPHKLLVISAFSSEIIVQSNIEAVSRALVSEGLARNLMQLCSMPMRATLRDRRACVMAFLV